MKHPTKARAFAGATVGNVICGFDILGLALDNSDHHLGDTVEVSSRPDTGVIIKSIHSIDSGIPTDPSKNVAGVAAMAVLERSEEPETGLEIEIWKGLPLSGGMGGSSASSVAAAIATDSLLNTKLSKQELMVCALEGEKLVTGSMHPDNVAPAIHGGIVLMRPEEPTNPIPLPVPRGMSLALIHPKLELNTKSMRAVLPDSIPLAEVTAQCADASSFVLGLFEENWDLLKKVLVDRIAEPSRKQFVPGLDEVRSAAVSAGALGAGISGSGPSIFALCQDETKAVRAGQAMKQVFHEMDIVADLFVRPIAQTGTGAQLLDLN